MTGSEPSLIAKLDGFIEMVRARDWKLIDALWGDGDFWLVGSEVDEICRTRPELAAKLGSVFAHSSTFVFDFPCRTVKRAGSVAWIFAEGTLTRREPDGTEQSRRYLACCIFEHVNDAWYWRKFFGSEPY